MSDTEIGANTNSDDSTMSVWRKHRHQGIVALLVLSLGLVWWIYQRTIYVYTNDARVATNLVVISSKSAGLIENLAVKEGSFLEPGDLIAQLDLRETQLLLEELKALLKAMEANIAQGTAEIAMVERQTGGALQTAFSQLRVAEASLVSTQSAQQLKQAEWKRSQSLREDGILSLQSWEQIRSAFQVAEQNQNQARAQVASAQGRVVEANASRDRLAVLEQKQLRLQHERNRVARQLERQQVVLDERSITSPLRGIVDQTFVHTGEYLLPGQRIAIIHNPEDVWVKANIRETQIRHLQLGQAVRVSVDAYPGKKFNGELVRIGNAATSQFALLPSTNPSGNFTKISQRLPVKISVASDGFQLMPGMMVEIAIDIRR